MNLDTIGTTSVKNAIQQVYKKLGKSIHFDDITFNTIMDSFSSYMINNEEYGYIHIQKYTNIKNLVKNETMDYLVKINVSTSDKEANFPFFSGIPKKINYTFDDNLQLTEISIDLKFINETHKLEIRTRFDNGLNLVFIDYCYIDKITNKLDNKSFRKAIYTESHYNCYQMDNSSDENIFAQCHIAQFMQPKIFSEIFPEFSIGPLQKILDFEDINKRLLIFKIINH